MQLTSAAAGVDSIRVSFTDPAGRAHSASATVTWLAPLLPQDRDQGVVSGLLCQVLQLPGSGARQ